MKRQPTSIELQKIRAGAAAVYLFGEITYRDAFGRSRITQFYIRLRRPGRGKHQRQSRLLYGGQSRNIMRLPWRIRFFGCSLSSLLFGFNGGDHGIFPLNTKYVARAKPPTIATVIMYSSSLLGGSLKRLIRGVFL